MIEIDDLPSPLPLACSTCCEPLTWIWVHHLKRNIAVIPLREPDRFSFRIHTCDLSSERTWRNVQRFSPEETRRGRKAARLAAKQALKKLNDTKNGEGRG